MKDFKNSSKPVTPPDLNNPPSNIPLRSISDRYNVIEEIGTGSFGCVTLAKSKFDMNSLDQFMNCHNLLNNSTFKNNYMTKSQNLVAIKTMMTRLSTLHDYTRVREVKFILSVSANKHLIQIFEMFIDNTNFHLHIIMECMEQNLYQMMRHRRRRFFSIPSLKSILAQILAGIIHIHNEGFFHRDLKPENILVSPSSRYFDKDWLSKGYYHDNYVVKLADFGLARNINNPNPYTEYVSTRWYRSPEILLRNGYYSKPLDIWAFGCVALEVTIFKPLFPGSNEIDQIWKILQVLGTPHKVIENTKTHYSPHGGFWEQSKKLANNLNLKFPYIEGVSINSFISSNQLNDLIQVIENCLKWDPENRATAVQLSKMDFFKATVVQQEQEENSLSNTEQAMLFAGINTDRNNNNNNSNNNINNNNHTKPHEILFNDKNIFRNTSVNTDSEKLTLNEFLTIEKDEDIVEELETDSSYSDDIEKSLSFYQLPKDLPILPDNLTTTTNHDSLTNIKNLSNEIEILTKDNNSEMFADCIFKPTTTTIFEEPCEVQQGQFINIIGNEQGHHHDSGDDEEEEEEDDVMTNTCNYMHYSGNFMEDTIPRNFKDDDTTTQQLKNKIESNQFFSNITF
ncbi:hypothetical protein KAFR_0A01340 [Kazachstania africana CBS 2517]|uniref:Protein kinase domain-containing protein n=1 Tax=Kazachstania africana (strain ATCC 22294 / BCRC 22015 / CBS 2517 / CECT 1963 / NBRC 1671 / NRRL Y-8276) TaxID=1071382 RepID=H2AMH2_KAZAF|nr:hypothetical protein KAFR_0A01340 [Kazachstania africana CBS 2517]CCF55572.1 hypothetical protein KAFR_0A01340 [Kazachstania africana CBS 2517]